MAKVAYPLFENPSGMSAAQGAAGPGPSFIPVTTPQVTPSTYSPNPTQVNPYTQVDTAVDNSVDTFDSAFSVARALSQENTAQSQAFAREQMAFQKEQNAKAMQFSADQAKLNRDFQERMSNTSHQREVQDLLKAGLNPVLSALAGSSTPSGSAASGVTSGGASGTVDTTAASLIGSVLNSLIGQETAISVAEVNKQALLSQANINARTQKEINDASLENIRYLAREYPSSLPQLAASAVHNVDDFIGSLDSGKGLAQLWSQFVKKTGHRIVGR